MHVWISSIEYHIAFSSSTQVSWHHTQGNNIRTNARFKHSILRIDMHMVSFHFRSIMLYDFVCHFFTYLVPVLKISMLTPQFSTRWHPRGFYSIAQVCFLIPTHHFYEYSSSHSEVKTVTRDSGEHTVHICKYIIKNA